MKRDEEERARTALFEPLLNLVCRRTEHTRILARVVGRLEYPFNSGLNFGNVWVLECREAHRRAQVVWPNEEHI